MKKQSKLAKWWHEFLYGKEANQNKKALKDGINSKRPPDEKWASLYNAIDDVIWGRNK